MEGIFGIDIAADAVLARERAVLFLILGTTLGTMILVTLIGLYLGNLFVDPVIKLSAVAKKITDGDLSARAQIETTDEVGELAKDFNLMTSQLQETLQGLERRVADRTRNLELAAEYLLMAAMLIEIKSRMLLPPKKTAEGQEAEDPRAELVRRLLEYEQIKLAAAGLGNHPQYGRDFLKAQVYIEQSLQPRFPEVHVADLQEAWADILKRARLVQHHKISREELSVREHMSIVLRQLQGQKFVEFEHLFDPAKGVPVLVVTFIALLELAKESLIDITQAEVFAPIYVRLAYSPA